MNLITRLKNNYRWEFIGVWVVILAGCFGTLFLVAMLFFSGCSNSSAKTQPAQQSDSTQAFTLPQMPSSLTDPASRADYLVMHYWDHFDFSDTTLIHLPEVTEQAFVDYIDLLSRVKSPSANSSIWGFLTKCEANSTMYSYFTGQFENYLYEPNSPVRNEELYLAVVEYILVDKHTDQANKIRPAFIRNMILKNRMGTKGADFSYATALGKTGRLYDLKTDFILLFFNNPDCHACKEVKDAIKASPLFTELVQKGKLAILAFYPDEDISLWKKQAAEIPASWINGFDDTQTFKKDVVYDLRAIPSLYLLDKDKTVLLKDADFVQTERYLLQLVR